MDMLCHWQYLLENLFGKINAVSCLGTTHIPERVDENGQTWFSAVIDPNAMKIKKMIKERTVVDDPETLL